MIFEHQSKNKKILVIISIAILVIGAGIMYSPIIFQEGNPLPEIKGIAELTFGKSDIVKLSGSDNKYMTESKNGMVIHDFMKAKGYEFTEQMGSGYFFESPTGQNAVVTHRYYSRYYSLWSVAENTDIIETDSDFWTTATNDDGIAFKYPEELPAEYISTADWPPVIKIENGTYSCETTPQEVSSMLAITSERLIDDNTYCVKVEHEGAAGSVYSSYTYTTLKEGELAKISFSLRYPNCLNYDEEKSEECYAERESFDVDSIAHEIVRSLTKASD